MTGSLSVAIDIGGTFTDVTLQDASTGRAWRAKTPSVPSDPGKAFIAGIHLALDAAGASPAQIGRVLHGTTVATNLILEGKGARTGLVTTAGFRHVLEIGRQDIPRRSTSMPGASRTARCRRPGCWKWSSASRPAVWCRSHSTRQAFWPPPSACTA